MIYPLKQYRQFLLVSAILCTLTLLLFSVLKVYATDVPAVRSARSVYTVPNAPVALSAQASPEVPIQEAQSFSPPTSPTLSDNLFNNLSIPTFPKNSADGLATLMIHNERDAAVAYQIQVTSRAGDPVFDQLGTIQSNGTVRFAATDVSDIPNGDYQITVFSDGPLNALVSIEESGSQSLGLYNGVGPIASTPIFGPLFHGDTSSTLILANTFAATVTTQIDFIDLTGTTIMTHTQEIPADGGVKVALATIVELPDNFVGTATVSSQDGNFTGVVQQVDELGKITYQNALPNTTAHIDAQRGSSATNARLNIFNLGLPTVFKGVTPDEDIPTQTSSLFVTSIDDSEANVVATVYDYASSAQAELFEAMVLPSMASLLKSLSEPTDLDVGRYSAVFSSDRPLLVTAMSTFDKATSYGSDSYRPASGLIASKLSAQDVNVQDVNVQDVNVQDVNAPSVDAQSVDAQSVAALPRVVKDGANHSVVSIQNVGAAESIVSLTFYDLQGSPIYTQTETGLQPNRAMSINLRVITELPSNYIGSLRIASDQPFASQVDEYQDFATPITPDPVTLTITGPDRALLNQPMQAIASVTPNLGTPGSAVYPIGYVWTTPLTTAVTLHRSSNGVTSTGTITWGGAGIHVVEVTANTGVGAVTEQYPIAVSARSVSITNFQTTTFGYSTNDGSGIRIIVPGQTLNGDIQLDYLPLTTPYVSGPTDQGFDGGAFELHVIQSQQRSQDHVFDQAINLTITYNPTLLSGGDKQMLTLRRWTGAAWEDVSTNCGPSPAYTRELDQNRFSVPVCQAGQFALFGALVTVFVPLVQ